MPSLIPLFSTIASIWRRDVNVLAVLTSVEPEVFGVEFHSAIPQRVHRDRLPDLLREQVLSSVDLKAGGGDVPTDLPSE